METTPGRVSLIVLGMAGSGKTTFVKKLSEHLNQMENSPYLINLDPACLDTPYEPNIDIRDTINYKKVMEEHSLGPNGAIITSLNLFVTQFNQLVTLMKSREETHKLFVFDTPGQIEVFNWSASGMIITETLSSVMATSIVFVMDTVRNTNPTTFISNMLYACSILYRTKLPLIVVLNKSDLQNPEFIKDWMSDFEKFQDALEREEDYVSNLTRSLSLVLDDFYRELKTACVSSKTGDGLDEFLVRVQEAEKEYNEIYKKEVNEMKERISNVVLPSNKDDHDDDDHDDEDDDEDESVDAC